MTLLSTLFPGSGGGVATIEYVFTADDTLTTAECTGTVINNYGQADDVTLTLPAASAGLSFVVTLGTTTAHYLHFDPNSSEVIYFNGVALTGGYWAGIASCTIGATIIFHTFKTGASAWSWYVSPIYGDWVYQT
jgi:hypothetical protein